MLDLALKNGARFLLASTSEVYGDPQVHPQPECYWGNVNPVGPRSVYDEAKRFSEALTTAYRTAYGLDAAIVRLFNCYGPRMRMDDGRMVPTFIRQALSSQSITVSGTGEQTRSICYVDDAVEGIIRLLHSDHSGPMNIGTESEMTVLEVANLVKEITSLQSPIQFVSRPVDDPSLRRPDLTLARTVLGWEPKVGTREGLERTISWFRSGLGGSARAGDAERAHET
jgi:nucleoside-diphosphate-sugar epimerase